MQDRTYTVPVDAKVTINDEGEVQVEIYLGYLALGVQEDADLTLDHPADVVERDREAVQRKLLASPFNHSISTTLVE